MMQTEINTRADFLPDQFVEKADVGTISVYTTPTQEREEVRGKNLPYVSNSFTILDCFKTIIDGLV